MFRKVVEPKHAADLPIFTGAAKSLCRIFPGVHCEILYSGEHQLEASSTEFLDIAFQVLEIHLCYSIVEFKSTDIQVSLRETITAQSQLCLSKSPNKHNRLWVQAEPMEKGLMNAIELGKIKIEVWCYMLPC